MALHWTFESSKDLELSGIKKGFAREERSVLQVTAPQGTVWQNGTGTLGQGLCSTVGLACGLGPVLGFTLVLCPVSTGSLRTSMHLAGSWQGHGWAGTSGA